MLRGELDWIVMKCLEKDRTRRYATAHDLAEEVQRFLDGEPVLARPASNVYRLQKLLHRHQRAVAAAALLALSLIAGVAISTWQAIRATHAEHAAEHSRNEELSLRRQSEEEKAAAELNEYVADINLAEESLKDGNYGRAVQLLTKHDPRPGEPDLRGFEWRYLWQQSRGDHHSVFPTQEEAIEAMAFSPSGDLLALGLRDKVNIWDIKTRSLIRTLPKTNVVSLVFFPDGQRLITASHGSVRIWKTADWTEEAKIPQGAGPIALSRDGKRLAVDGFQLMSINRDRMQRVRVWDTDTWQEIRTLPGAEGPMAFSPDGRKLVANGRNGMTIWSLDGNGSEVVLENSTNILVRAGPWSSFDRVLSFSPDGRSVIAARNIISDHGVFVLSIWDAESGDELASMPNDPEHIEHTGVISAMAFSPDGKVLATSSADHSIRLWDLPNRQRIGVLQGHLTEVSTLAFMPDGKTVCSGGKDGGVKFWSVRRETKEDMVQGPWEPLGFANDGRTLLLYNSRQAVVNLLNPSTLESEQTNRLEFPRPEQGRFRGPPFAFVAYAPSAQKLAYSADFGSLRLCAPDGRGTNFVRLPGRRNESLLAVSPDATTLITRGWEPMNSRSLEQTNRWWDLRDLDRAPVMLEGHRALFSPDGKTLAMFKKGNAVTLWDASSRTLRTNLVVDPAPGIATAFSPNGRILAFGAGNDDVENAIRFLDTHTGKLIGSCIGHKQGVVSVCFSPDGKTLASSGDDNTLRFWNVANQQELFTLRKLGGTLANLMFSPDGQILVGATRFPRSSAGIRFFRGPSLQESELAAMLPETADQGFTSFNR